MKQEDIDGFQILSDIMQLIADPDSLCKGERQKEQMVFDWNKAAELIKELNPIKVSAGLELDWETTNTVIYEEGDTLNQDDNYWLSSDWAIPTIEIDGKRQPCWVWQHERILQTAQDRWPEKALKILNAK